MESLPSSPIDMEEGFTFENGQDDTISVQVKQPVFKME